MRADLSLYLEDAENFAVDAGAVGRVARGLNREATVEGVVGERQFHEIPLHQLHHPRDAYEREGRIRSR